MSGLILPTIDELNRPFWAACRRGELVLQCCSACGRRRYPIAQLCPTCLCDAYTWEPVSGRGNVYSFTVFRHAYNDAWRDRIPYVVALIALDEGPFMLTDLVNVSPEDVRVDLPVTAVFEAVTDEVTIPRFTPVQ
ncbi:MAG TPA: OB-fold domain-containing protein [Solirubrobacteraceae bacterium]|nr:OB-fold domain-containing protein [Solirubrobacteraceae bacterium]